MKKVIATLLISIIGSMGYVVVDKTTDERISNLENQIASQQEIISSYENNSWTDENSTYNMEIGDSLPCYPQAGSVYKTVENSEYVLDKFDCTLTKKDSNGIPVFTINIKGHILEKNQENIYMEVFSNKDFGNFGTNVSVDENGYFNYSKDINYICDKCTFVLSKVAFSEEP